jgi:hypothetical protein
MKTIPEIQASINSKIEEHKKEIQLANDELEDLKKDKKAYGSMQVAMKHIVLKDKIMFHKAAILTLDDLKQTING